MTWDTVFTGTGFLIATGTGTGYALTPNMGFIGGSGTNLMTISVDHDLAPNSAWELDAIATVAWAGGGTPAYPIHATTADLSGNVVTAQVDGVDPTLVHWTVDAATDVTGATGPGFQADDGGGPADPIAIVVIDAQHIDCTYAAAFLAGDTWDAPILPAGVVIAGGFWTANQTGSLT